MLIVIYWFPTVCTDDSILKIYDQEIENMWKHRHLWSLPVSRSLVLYECDISGQQVVSTDSYQ